MRKFLIHHGVRTWFALMPRSRADAMASQAMERYLLLVETVTDEQGRRPVRVPVMPGVDPDMQDWSLFMVLEHNAIVNRAMGSVVAALARGEVPSGDFNPKKDVMPSADPGREQVKIFRASVEDHLAMVQELGPLRGKGQWRHPVFGMFDAHRWHCMFGFHLRLHLKQALLVARQAAS